MTLKCIIIDDEPLAAMLLEGYARKTPSLEVIAQFSSGVQAAHSEKLQEADLIFLDIQMPTLNGLEFSKMVPERTKIIFTTAFKQYALDSYRVNALDYLLKPISYSDFLASVQRAVSWFELKSKAVNDSTVATTTNNTDFIYVKSEYKLYRVELNSLLYVEGLKDYVKFHIEGESKPLLSLMNLKRAEELLPESDFIRVHRSYIVRKDKIKIIERGRILFDKEIVPIGESYKDAVQEYLNC